MTNTDDPIFVVESLETLTANNYLEDDGSLKAIIFAVNQKGRSPGVILKDFAINNVVDSRSGMLACNKNKFFDKFI